MITLKSNRLRVRIAEPGEAPNQTHRFDRAGFISEIRLDDRISFCASEPENLSHPCTGGRGLCRSIAEALHDSVAEVILVGSSDAARLAAQEMGAHGAPVHAVTGNLADRQECTRIFED